MKLTIYMMTECSRSTKYRTNFHEFINYLTFISDSHINFKIYDQQYNKLLELAVLNKETLMFEISLPYNLYDENLELSVCGFLNFMKTYAESLLTSKVVIFCTFKSCSISNSDSLITSAYLLTIFGSDINVVPLSLSDICLLLENNIEPNNLYFSMLSGTYIVGADALKVRLNKMNHELAFISSANESNRGA